MTAVGSQPQAPGLFRCTTSAVSPLPFEAACGLLSIIFWLSDTVICSLLAPDFAELLMLGVLLASQAR